MREGTLNPVTCSPIFIQRGHSAHALKDSVFAGWSVLWSWSEGKIDNAGPSCLLGRMLKAPSHALSSCQAVDSLINTWEEKCQSGGQFSGHLGMRPLQIKETETSRLAPLQISLCGNLFCLQFKRQTGTRLQKLPSTSGCNSFKWNWLRGFVSVCMCWRPNT